MDRRQGIVVRFHSNFVTVEDAQTRKRYLCTMRGRFKSQNIRPIIGDIVEYVFFPDSTGIIENIFPRRNELDRPHIANIDQILLISTLKYPEVSTFILDRFLILAERKGLEVIILFNKIDLLNPTEKSLLSLYESHYSDYYTFITLSAKTGEGIPYVVSYLSGKITTLAGMSGVGKSTLLNYIDPTLHLKEGEISRQLEVGKHTTTYSELLPIGEKGLVADTPGFANLDVSEIDREALRFCFPEFVQLAANCYFDDCMHIDEPNCAVRDAAEKGKFLFSRYENYLRILPECKGKA